MKDSLNRLNLSWGMKERQEKKRKKKKMMMIMMKVEVVEDRKTQLSRRWNHKEHEQCKEDDSWNEKEETED